VISSERKKSEGKFNPGIYAETGSDLTKSYFGNSTNSYKNFSSYGKKRERAWDETRLGGRSGNMKLIPAQKDSESRARKIQSLSGSIMSFC
jgi:hypothetical protein